jgi:hypothetical protein
MVLLSRSTLSSIFNRRGLYEPRGVRPVHQDSYPRAEGGVPFNTLVDLRVCMHDRRFSPCNANVRIDHSVDTATFFSLVVDKVRGSGMAWGQAWG